MVALTAKTETDGSSIPRLEAKGVETAGTASDSEQFKPCQHPGHGCISQNGYGCLHDGPVCQPMDNNGREFTIREWIEDGTRMTTRDFKPVPVRTGNKAVCSGRCMCQPENHAGKGACGKIINADSPTAPAQVREQCLQKLAAIRAGPHSVRTVH